MGTRRREDRQTSLVVVLLVVALLGAGTAAVVVEGLGRDGGRPGSATVSLDPVAETGRGSADPAPGAADCAVVAPASLIGEAVRKAIAGSDPSLGSCRLIPASDADQAQVWIPESALQVDAEDPGWELVSPSLATSPVGLVGAPGAERPRSWSAVLDSGELLLPAPGRNAASLVALTALTRGITGADLERTEDALARAGLRSGGGPASKTTGTGARTWTPVSESDYRQLSDVTWAAPADELPVLDFPLLVRADADPRTRVLATGIADWFSGPAGRRALAAVGLRPPDLSEIGTGVGPVTVLPVQAAHGRRVVALAARLDRAAARVRVLTLLDASGSMKERIGDDSRAELAVAAQHRLLELLPVGAEVGAWAFSIEQGAAGQDWVELAPTRRLGDAGSTGSHAALLVDRGAEYLSLLRGGTGLHDSVLAAYRNAQRHWKRDARNLVVLFSDGSDDDPDSVGIEALLSALRQGTSGNRPVQVVGVGIGADVDMSTMERIAEATDGVARRIGTAEEMTDLVTQVLAAR